MEGFWSAGGSGGGVGVAFVSSGIESGCASRFGVELFEDGGRAGLLFDRVRRCDLEGLDVESFVLVPLAVPVPSGLPLPDEVTDFVRER